MLDDANSYRKLLQMPLLTSISFPSLAKTSVSPTAHPCIDIVSSAPSIPSRSRLESMPPEILDRIASFVTGASILQLCHAVRYYKYISQAMFDFGHPLPTRNRAKPLDVAFWPRVFLGEASAVSPFEEAPRVPMSHLHVLQSFSSILNKHGGYASIDDSPGTDAFLGALTENVNLSVCHTMPAAGMDKFFSAVYNAKNIIRNVDFEVDYFDRCEDDPASLNMTAKWLVKLPIHNLRFMSIPRLPTQIMGVLHLMPMLGSLHLPSLEDCGAIALSECKLLKKLSIATVFHAEESPEELVQKVVHLVKLTKIQQVTLQLPSIWQTILRGDLRVLMSALFLRNGWREHPEALERLNPSAAFVCRRTRETSGCSHSCPTATILTRSKISAKKIPNPAYKGAWVHPEIDNPEFKEDTEIYAFKNIYVGFDLRQVKSGTIFDNIIMTDSLDEAKEFAKKTFDDLKDAEKDAKDKLDAKEKKEAEEKKKAEKKDDAKSADAEEVSADEDEHAEL
ncbi:hypothetical protein HDU80_001437 [Chytriomyces hyalinus]|nr:hypothetical protein HDU80_001437 [Chytriomyces hyalinus]